MMDGDPLWYKDAIIYELHVRAFSDSTGDGVGDFRGLAEKLDYLKDLGVSTLWLLPFATARRRVRHLRLHERPPFLRNADRLQAPAA
jgi:pullulanase/glycogen debranching enzyme